jgi:hypothetical protein
VRTRAYLDSGDCAFEVKLKGPRDQTVKARLPYPVAARAHLTADARGFLAGQLLAAYGQPAPRLAARVVTAYQRTTLVDLRHGTRLTCDVDLVCSGAGRVATGLSRHVLVESKSPGPASGADPGPARPRPATGPDEQVLRRGRPALPGDARQPLAPHPAALLPPAPPRRGGRDGARTCDLVVSEVGAVTVAGELVHRCFQLWPASDTLVLAEASVGFDCLRSRTIRLFFTSLSDGSTL